MKKFKFRLEKILRLRESERDEKKRVLMQAQSVLNQIEKDIESRLGARSELFLSQNAVLPFSALLVNDQYRIRLESEVVSLNQQLEEQKIEVELRFGEFKEAQKEVKALETLKERKLQEYHQKVEMAEAKELDEFAVLSESRRQ